MTGLNNGSETDLQSRQFINAEDLEGFPPHIADSIIMNQTKWRYSYAGHLYVNLEHPDTQAN